MKGSIPVHRVKPQSTKHIKKLPANDACLKYQPVLLEIDFQQDNVQKQSKTCLNRTVEMFIESLSNDCLTCLIQTCTMDKKCWEQKGAQYKCMHHICRISDHTGMHTSKITSLSLSLSLSVWSSPAEQEIKLPLSQSPLGDLPRIQQHSQDVQRSLPLLTCRFWGRGGAVRLKVQGIPNHEFWWILFGHFWFWHTLTTILDIKRSHGKSKSRRV